MPGYKPETWNPATGCSPISEGCEHCYAKRMIGRNLHGYDFKPRMHPDRLDIPLHWRKPRFIFVCSMGDLFHEDVPFEFVDKVLAVAALCPQHIFVILTKRADRMYQYFQRFKYGFILNKSCPGWVRNQYLAALTIDAWQDTGRKNLWLGVTAENQRSERIGQTARLLDGKEHNEFPEVAK